MPIDRTMSVSLSDANRRTIVTFRRSGGQVFVDTVEDGVAREHPVTPVELSQLASFLDDLATTRWSDDISTEASTTAGHPATPVDAQPVARASTLPPYPQSARWVPAPAGGQVPSADDGRD